ncbi:YihY/virulence factor BrkB family protein [Phormidium sp. FACHB-1136]|uniref:YihY/virulence factor BrkB family protein n=1 Tax=Phormidium sp. FACHB-1136 TaxID=2692848 RepID=UPI0016830E2D|nr:YihY/virulence factor BrkB family protein [Phormidium sp. FACHB-1136]MBD2428356.1 YihY/virulence factor BrkB family protein [Phormidium sp. FACHB-1136]
MIRYFQTTVFPYLKAELLPSRPAQLLIQTGLKWDRDNVPGMAAALSYYALFSLFPLLLVLLSIFGVLIGPNTEAFLMIQDAIERFLPTEVHDLVKETVIALNQNSVGAGLVGFVLLLFMASTIFVILKRYVNQIWQSPSRVTEAGSPLKMATFFIVNKLSGFLLVFGTALLLFASLVSNIAIKIILKLVNEFQELLPFIQIDELQLSRGLQVSSSLFILSIAICILFKILPTVRLSWNDVWLGGLLTASALVGLQQLVSNSVISIGGRFLSYGVIGSVMILMLWIFLACQIFFFGCELSYVYAHLFGSRRQRRMDRT